MRKINYLLSFLIPIGILFIISQIAGYIPFGNSTFNVFDAYYEYPTFLIELRNMFHDGRNLFYTLNGALGVNFFSILNLYGGSPLNLLVYFFNNENIYLFYTLLIYLKIGLSGLTMYIFLNSLKTKYQASFWNVIFSFIYALSSYAVAFNMHIMWLDAYILLPLIIKELNNLIMNDKGFKYSLFLSLAIIINYYTGFMLCIFMFIYYLYKSFIEHKLNIASFKRFIYYSLGGVLFSCVILIPNIINLFSGRFSTLEKTNLWGLDLFTLGSQIYNMTIGSFIRNDNYNFGSTTIYITIFALVLIINYFLNKNISKRNKIATGMILLFFNICFSFKLFDYAWNMFQSPIWWSHRYQFVYVFLTLLIAYNSFCAFESINLKNKTKNIITILFMIIVIASFSYKLLGLRLSDYYVLTLFISIIFFLIYFHKLKINYFFVILILIELGLNSYTILKSNEGQNYKAIVGYNKDKNKLLSTINDKDSYRILDINAYENEGLLFNYHSLELFSSSYNMQTAKFMTDLNIEEFLMNHQTVSLYNPAILSLLGVKYIIGNSNYYDCKENYCINNYALPFMYEINDELLNINITDDYQDNINKIYSSLLGNDIDLFNELPNDAITLKDLDINKKGEFINHVDKSQIIINYFADKDYIVIPNNNFTFTLGSTNIKINDEDFDYNKKNSDKLIVLKKGDTLEIIHNYTDEKTYSLEDCKFTLLDIKEYENAISEIKSNTNYKNFETNDYILKGKINVLDNKVMLTISYDAGLKIYVDNKEVDYYKILNTFVGIDVEPGEHVIKVSYVPKGLKLGLGVSIGTLLLYIYLELKKGK